MNKYIGKYRVFMAIDKNGKPSSNKEDTYLKCKYKTEIYRFNEKELAVYFKSNLTMKNTKLKLEELGIEIRQLSKGDNESVWLFNEEHIEQVCDLLKPITSGKNIKPNSIRTVRRIIKKQKL